MTDQNSHTSIADKVLERIETETPRSRTYFWLRNILIWLLAGLSVVIGALAVSLIIFRIINASVAFGPDRPILDDLFLIVPIVWIGITALFGYLAYREVRSTRRGYRYQLSTIILGTVLASVVLGVLFFAAGTGFILDRLAGRHAPLLHQDLERVQGERWLRPENGFLIGTVEATSANGVVISDPREVRWEVVFEGEALSFPLDSLEPGERVGMRGRVADESETVFVACEIRSLELEGRRPFRPLRDQVAGGGERKIDALHSNGCEDVRPRN